MRAFFVFAISPWVLGCGLILNFGGDAPGSGSDAGLVDASDDAGGPRDAGVADVAASTDAGNDFDAALVRPDPCGGLSCLSDDFSGAILDPVWGTYVVPGTATGGSVTQSGDLLTITTPSGITNAGRGIVSRHSYDARSDRVTVRVVSTAAAPGQTILLLRYSPDDWAGMVFQSGTLIFASFEAGVVADRNDISFMPDDQPWWQLRGEGGRLYFEVSSTGTDFVTLWDIAAPPWLAAAGVELGVNAQGAVAGSSAQFDDLSSDPVRVATPHCPIDQPTDDFDDAQLDPYLWVDGSDASCTVTEASGVLTLSGLSTRSNPCSFLTRHAYDLRFGVYVQRAATSPAHALVFGVRDAAGASVVAGCSSDVLYLGAPGAAPGSAGDCPTERYWRLAHVRDRVELSVADAVGSFRTVASVPAGTLRWDAVHFGASLEPAEAMGGATEVSIESVNLP